MTSSSLPHRAHSILSNAYSHDAFDNVQDQGDDVPCQEYRRGPAACHDPSHEKAITVSTKLFVSPLVMQLHRLASVS